MGGVGGGRIEGDANPYDGRTKRLPMVTFIVYVCEEADRVDGQITDS